MERSWLKSLLAPGSIIRIGIATVAAVLLWLVISAWIGDRTSLSDRRHVARRSICCRRSGCT